MSEMRRRGEAWTRKRSTPIATRHGLHFQLLDAHELANAVGDAEAVILGAAAWALDRGGFPLTLELSTPRLPKRSWVKISQVRTLSVERIGKRLARVSAEDLGLVVDGLNEIIGV